MSSETAHTKPFTGSSGQRATRRSVKIADALARALITLGGIGAIIAVLTVCLFLVWVVVPLFQPAEVQGLNEIPIDWQTKRPLHVAVDEYQLMAWALLPDGKMHLFRLDNGEVCFETQLFDGRKVTCASFENDRPEAAFGFADGKIQVLKIGFETSYPKAEEIPHTIRDELAAKPTGAPANLGGGVVQLTPEGQFRHQKLHIEKLRAQTVSQTAIRLIDLVIRPSGPLICVVTGADDALELKAIPGKEKENFLTGGKTLAFGRPIDLPMKALSSTAPRYLGISGVGSDIYVAWEDGWLLRVHCSDLKKAFIAEEGRLVEQGNTLSAIGFILGGTTLVWGDSRGEVRGGFPVRYKEFRGEGLHDSTLYRQRAQYIFAVAKRLARSDSAMISMSPSGRSRLVACGFRDGHVRIFNVTNAGCLASLQVPSDDPNRRPGVNAPVIGLAFAPKEDGFIALTPNRGYYYRFDPMHPEANAAAFFRPVWYEGYPRPLHVWQSSSGTDDFEPKLGLMPLVFGTIKATFYAMLFGVPLALLAAVYSSEFLHPRVKGVVKPMIELMASLPSVVLGFLAAIVFAPFVENVIPTTLSLFVSIPFSFLLGAYVWQLMPRNLTLRLTNQRFIFMVLPMVFGVFLAAVVGPSLENLLFCGDIKSWLAWRPGIGDASGGAFSSPFGGWVLLCLPISALGTAMLVNRSTTPWSRRLTTSLSRTALVWVEFFKFGAAALFAIVLTALIAFVLGSMGLDPRGDFILWATDISPLDVYVQRNALIVGFVMGFAIIPIIYTIAEDALSAVPEHLRSASLGAGATQWQTAIRIVIPTAMSGIFSALMIGLGRAVGETMIVLMALGNTPIMDWNIFNGARTLSANIAVELPEAVRNSTHYRTLFLAALVLFAMTLLVNTAAEIVRLRFRKRAYQL